MDWVPVFRRKNTIINSNTMLDNKKIRKMLIILHVKCTSHSATQNNTKALWGNYIESILYRVFFLLNETFLQGIKLQYRAVMDVPVGH